MTDEFNNRILELLIDDEEITWQAIITNLIKTENIDPSDIDIISLTDRFIDTVKKLKDLDFRISGKIILAAAILLRIKSVYIVTNGINNFDRMFQNKVEDEVDDVLDSPQNIDEQQINTTLDQFGIVPRTPLPRKRKVSVYDLIDALEKAMASKNKRIVQIINDKNDTRLKKLLERNVDITVVISDLYSKIIDLFKEDIEWISFESLLTGGNIAKRDKVLTFLPLLYLESKHKILMDQKESFGNILIKLRDEIASVEVAENTDDNIDIKTNENALEIEGAKKLISKNKAKNDNPYVAIKTPGSKQMQNPKRDVSKSNSLPENELKIETSINASVKELH